MFEYCQIQFNAYSELANIPLNVSDGSMLLTQAGSVCYLGITIDPILTLS